MDDLYLKTPLREDTIITDSILSEFESFSGQKSKGIKHISELDPDDLYSVSFLLIEAFWGIFQSAQHQVLKEKESQYFFQKYKDIPKNIIYDLNQYFRSLLIEAMIRVHKFNINFQSLGRALDDSLSRRPRQFNAAMTQIRWSDFLKEEFKKRGIWYEDFEVRKNLELFKGKVFNKYPHQGPFCHTLSQFSQSLDYSNMENEPEKREGSSFLLPSLSHNIGSSSTKVHIPDEEMPEKTKKKRKHKKIDKSEDSVHKEKKDKIKKKSHKKIKKENDAKPKKSRKNSNPKFTLKSKEINPKEEKSSIMKSNIKLFEDFQACNSSEKESNEKKGKRKKLDPSRKEPFEKNKIQG